MLFCISSWEPRDLPPSVVTAAEKPASGAFPQAGVDGVPASVERLTIAFDGWGGDVIDPWQYIGTGLMQTYLNMSLFHRAQDFSIVPY